MKLWTLIMTTFRELAAKAALISLAGISSFILIFIALALGVETRADGIVLQMFGQDVQPAVSLDSLLPTVRALQAGLVRGLFTGIILFGIFATAGCIPGMMEKGTIDIYLSKPLSRGVLLLGKALGAVTVIFLNILYFVGGLWLIFGIKTGVWNPGFLISISTLTYTFIVLYSMVVLFGILFRSTAFPIIASFLYLFAAEPILANREHHLYLLSENGLYRGVIDTIHMVLPQISLLLVNVSNQVMEQPMAWEPFAQSVLSAAGFFGLGVFVFSRKDF